MRPSIRRFAPTRDERLSLWSSCLPWFSVSEDCVEDGEQLSHDGDQGELFRFAGLDQALVEGLERWVVFGGDEGGHVEGGADLGAAAPDGSPAAHPAAVGGMKGATPTSAAIFLRSRVPSSGRSAIRVRAVASPTPGTVLSRSSAWRHAGVFRMASAISVSRSESSRCRVASTRSTLLVMRRLARRLRRFRSAVIISTIWRLRATSSASARACAPGTGRGSGRIASAKWAIAWASRVSVLASLPVDRAKSRIWRGLTTASGRPAAHSAAAAVVSKPPVASSTTSATSSAPSRTANSSRPLPSRATAKASPDGRTCTSSRSFATSIPTKIRSMTRPCKCGLAGRTKRLFGFTGTADGEPCSSAVSWTKGNPVSRPLPPPEP